MQDMSIFDYNGLWNLGEDADELGLLTVVVAYPGLMVSRVHVGRRFRHRKTGG